jgi:sugar phosphate isomerase/epimerase
MMPKFSLAHLTVLGVPPPQAARIAADCGYDYVSFRTIPLGLPGEPRYELHKDAALLKETKAALASTGLPLLDIEIARIADGTRIADYRPHLETAAALGAKHVITAAYSQDRNFVVEALTELCQMAGGLGMTVDFEFITFSAYPTIPGTVQLLKDTGCANAGLLVDTLHFDRSRCTFAELDQAPRSMFHYAQLCDAARADNPTTEEMMRTAREERLYLGEGVIPVKEILSHMPVVPCTLEIAHKKRQQELGYPAFAKECLETARRYFSSPT